MDDLVLNTRQILQYATVAECLPTDAFLLQTGGLGGPYNTVSAVGLVQGAFNSGRGFNTLGDFIIDGSLAVGGNANINGLLEVVQGISTDGDITTNNGNILATIGNLEIGGAAHIGGNLLVGSINNQGTLTNAGDALFQGNVMINGSLGVANGVWGLVWFSPSTQMPPVTSGTPGVFWWQTDEQELMLWDGTNWHDLAGRHMELERWDQTDLMWDDAGWEWW